MTGNFTVAPFAYFSVAPQTSLAVPEGSSPQMASFQARSRSRAATASAGGATSMNVPMTEIPVLPVLKPYTWAPTTPRVTPPYRPS